MVAAYAEDVEYRLIGAFADLAGAEFRGRAAVRDFLTDWVENVGGHGEMETVLEADDRVVVIIHSVGAGSARGAPATMRWAQVYTFRDGRVIAVDNYYNASEALEAVGLSEGP